MQQPGGSARCLGRTGPNAPRPPATYVGSETCAGCHRAEAQLWQASQHKHAMDHATDKSVLGNFNDASFDYYGVHSRFFRKDGKFLVETDGPDGKLATFEVKYTFGIDPLQQYLVEFPDGRLQALSLAWDSRPKDQGGQRWFHLYPNEEIKHDDVLHWTKLNQNWNFMCAECHSTGVRKNYDAANDRFATSFAEISVGCEACHGQGSRHVDWAHARGRAGGRSARAKTRKWDCSCGSTSGAASPGPIDAEDRQCRAQLHAGVAAQGGRDLRAVPRAPRRVLRGLGPRARRCPTPMSSRRSPAGSIMPTGRCSTRSTITARSSRARCSRPASPAAIATSRTAPSFARPGDGVCLQCHSAGQICGRRRTTITKAQARRRPARRVTCRRAPTWWSIGGTTTACGFRGRTCRRSSARPMPATIATPTSRRNGRHRAIERWHGPNRKGFQNYAEAFRAAWTGERGRAGAACRGGGQSRHAPAIARATALTELAPYASPSNIRLARPALSDPDPMVRIGALDMLEGVPPRPALAAGFAAAVRSRPRRAHQGGVAARRGSGREPACRRPRTFRARRGGVRRRAAPQCRPPRSALARSADFYARRGHVRRGRGRIQGGAAG